MKGKKIIACLIATFLLVSLPHECQATISTGNTYYVDYDAGDDTHSGTTENQPWKSLNKVNSITFQPGDCILFKRGSVWSGQLAIKGSGMDGNPIIIDQYGQGPTKPRFIGDEGLNETVILRNQDYIEVNNLDISADYTTAQVRRGIYVENDDYGTMKHIYLKNLDIHDVHHNLSFQHNNSNKDCGGINVKVVGGEVVSKFDDFLIEGCHINNVGREGIYLVGSVWGNRNEQFVPSTRVVVRNNTLQNIQGDGIVILISEGALVEYNYLNTYNMVNASTSSYKGICYNAGMWAWNSDDCIFQYNECTGGISTLDGMSWDCDGLTNRIIYQYNYSYDNEGGSLLLCGDVGSEPTDCVYRYNISQNDRHYFVTAFNHKNPSIYNNVFYTGNGIRTHFMYTRTPSGLSGMELSNNIFMNEGLSSSGWKDTDTGLSYDYNTYYGNYSSTPTDPHKLLQNPLFVAPGTGEAGFGTLDGYKLQEGSPCINTGREMANSCDVDFYGNAIGDDQTDRGVHQVVNPQINTNLALHKNILASSHETDIFQANQANDGNQSTRWSSAYTDNEWIAVDLGQVYSIESVRIYWEAAYGRDYIVQTSLDGQSYTDALVIQDGDGGSDMLTIPLTDARYVRVQGTERATPWGYSIYELEVYGEPSNTPVNLIANGGFESGELTSWVGYGSKEVATDAYDGSYCARIGPQETGLDQVITGLTPNTEYELSAWVKVDDTNRSVALGVKWHGNPVVDVYSSETVYNKLTLSFMTGNDSTSARIYLWVPSGTGYAYGDAFELVEK